MLNVLYGWCDPDLKFTNEIYNNFITESVDKKHMIDTNKNQSTTCGLHSYSKYKPVINYSDEKYSLALIGHIKLHSVPNEANLAQEILKQYQHSGPSFFSLLRGQFTLSFIDKENNICVLINDVLATIPMFYSLISEQQFIFSNQLNLIAHSPGVSLKINQQAIYNYIYFHMIPSPGTIYHDVYKLEPGQCLIYKDGQFNVNYYTSPSFTEDNSSSEAELAQEIFDTLNESVKHCLDDPDSTGCFLSGGLDSSAVAGLLAKNIANAKTFSIGFPVEEYNEIEYARSAVRTFNTQQHEYFIQPDDVQKIIRKIVSAMDEPFGNSSVIPVYYCAKLAKDNNITRLLAGDGGDELFAGNTRYSKQQVFERYFLIPDLLRKKFIEPVSEISLFNSNFLGRKIKSYIKQANIPLPARLQTYNFLHLNTPESVFTESFLTKVDQNEPVELDYKTYHRPENCDYLNRMLFLDWKHTLADNDLRKVNMMCEIAGVDVSYPMLSNEMIELSCRIPAKLKLTPHKLRYLYKKSMTGFLPDNIINKPKHGFGLPFGVWTQTDKNLQKIAYEAIDKIKSYNIFNEQFLLDTIKNHQEVHASFYGELIWILMVLGIWLEQHELEISKI